MAALAERACRIAVPLMPVAPVTIARALRRLVGWYLYVRGEFNSTAGMCCGSVETEPLYLLSNLGSK